MADPSDASRLELEGVCEGSILEPPRARGTEPSRCWRLGSRGCWGEAGAGAYGGSQIEHCKTASQPITPKIPGLKVQLIAYPTTDTSAKPGPRATTKLGGQQIEKIGPRLK